MAVFCYLRTVAFPLKASVFCVNTSPRASCVVKYAHKARASFGAGKGSRWPLAEYFSTFACVSAWLCRCVFKYSSPAIFLGANTARRRYRRPAGARCLPRSGHTRALTWICHSRTTQAGACCVPTLITLEPTTRRHAGRRVCSGQGWTYVTAPSVCPAPLQPTRVCVGFGTKRWYSRTPKRTPRWLLPLVCQRAPAPPGCRVRSRLGGPESRTEGWHHHPPAATPADSRRPILVSEGRRTENMHT